MKTVSRQLEISGCFLPTSNWLQKRKHVRGIRAQTTWPFHRRRSLCLREKRSDFGESTRGSASAARAWWWLTKSSDRASNARSGAVNRTSGGLYTAREMMPNEAEIQTLKWVRNELKSCSFLLNFSWTEVRYDEKFEVILVYFFYFQHVQLLSTYHSFIIGWFPQCNVCSMWPKVCGHPSSCTVPECLSTEVVEGVPTSFKNALKSKNALHAKSYSSKSTWVPSAEYI